jgi:hypothetical protein
MGQTSVFTTVDIKLSLSPGLLTHMRIAYGLLFGHWSHKYKLVCQLF